MARFGRKTSFTDVLFSKVTVVILFLVSGFLAMSVYERYQVAEEMANRRAASEEAYQNLLERKDVLEDRVEYLRGESGKESEIRKHFDVVKEGEQVVIIVDDETQKQPVLDALEAPEPEEKPWYKFW